jgi:hypothetical protein
MTETSSLNRSWLVRMVFIAIVFVAFGGWGAWDAFKAYPARGLKHAEFLEKEYLDAADKRGRIMTTSVTSPALVHAQIKGQGGATDEVEGAKYRWLNALRIVGKLDESHTTISDPPKRLEELRAKWTTTASPKPLSELDIPTQYLIMVGCTIIGLLIVGIIVKASGTRYTLDPASSTLTLPGNHAVTPADLADVDKRKWHKYIVFLKLKPSHATLPDKEVRIDLLRHAKVEAWVLAMEAAAFPELAAKTPSTDAPAEPDGASESAPNAPTA